MENASAQFGRETKRRGISPVWVQPHVSRVWEPDRQSERVALLPTEASWYIILQEEEVKLGQHAYCFCGGLFWKSFFEAPTGCRWRCRLLH